MEFTTLYIRRCYNKTLSTLLILIYIYAFYCINTCYGFNLTFVYYSVPRMCMNSQTVVLLLLLYTFVHDLMTLLPDYYSVQHGCMNSQFCKFVTTLYTSVYELIIYYLVYYSVR